MKCERVTTLKTKAWMRYIIKWFLEIQKLRGTRVNHAVHWTCCQLWQTRNRSRYQRCTTPKFSIRPKCNTSAVRLHFSRSVTFCYLEAVCSLWMFDSDAMDSLAFFQRVIIIDCYFQLVLFLCLLRALCGVTHSHFVGSVLNIQTDVFRNSEHDFVTSFVLCQCFYCCETSRFYSFQRFVHI